MRIKSTNFLSSVWQGHVTHFIFWILETILSYANTPDNWQQMYILASKLFTLKNTIWTFLITERL